MTQETKNKISKTIRENYKKNGAYKSPHFRIYWIEGDKTFDSSKDAATFFEVTVGAISNHLNGRIKNIKGYHLQKVYSL